MKRGAEMNEVAVVSDGSIVVNNDGLIEAVGPSKEISSAYKEEDFETVVDAAGMSVIPGFVDGHTHPVWAGDRVHEFAMKLAGASYMDIHKVGGGIGYTVSCTRDSSEDDLLHSLLQRLRRMLKSGTTTVEAKSGYGLEADTEIKMLRVLHRAQAAQEVDIVSTFCGAHSVPKGSTAAQAADDVINVQLPALKAATERGEISPANIDVFLEKGVFELEDTRRILKAGQACGLKLNYHGDELSYQHAGELAGELKALAVSHLEHVSEEGMKAMAAVPTVAVLLPTTAYVLRIAPPPARKLIENGVPVALGSDFNPNAHCMSMPFVMNLACVLMHMTLNEALVAATINSAASLGLEDKCGSLEAGKQADMVLVGASRWEHVAYQLVDPPIAIVCKKGRIVVDNRGAA